MKLTSELSCEGPGGERKNIPGRGNRIAGEHTQGNPLTYI